MLVNAASNKVVTCPMWFYLYCSTHLSMDIAVNLLPCWDWNLLVNSLCPSDAIWRQRSGSTLAQIMACCLMVPSHYLNQCWLEINGIHPSAISQKMHKICRQKFSSKLRYSWIFMHLSGANELMLHRTRLSPALCGFTCIVQHIFSWTEQWTFVSVRTKICRLMLHWIKILQNISWHIHMVDAWSCCVVADNWLILPISFRVTSLALGQSYDCPSASEVILKDMGKETIWSP